MWASISCGVIGWMDVSAFLQWGKRMMIKKITIPVFIVLIEKLLIFLKN